MCCEWCSADGGNKKKRFSAYHIKDFIQLFILHNLQQIFFINLLPEIAIFCGSIFNSKIVVVLLVLQRKWYVDVVVPLSTDYYV